MGLKTSPVYRCLDKKSMVFGFEIVDLFLVFTVLAFLNFLLGSIQYKFFFTWGPSLALALFIRIMKRGKPENYLQHLLKFYFDSKVQFAFGRANKRTVFKNYNKGISHEQKPSR